MHRFLAFVIVSALMAVTVSRAFADEKAAKEIVDKAIKAAGGEEVLSKAKAVSWKAKGTIFLNGNENEFKTDTVIQGLDHIRAQFEGEFGGNLVKAVTVINGDKGWRNFQDNTTELDADDLSREKRNLYLQVTPTLLLPLKSKGFKLDTAPDEKIGDKPASVVKVTGPDGKDFTIWFDKETNLPAKSAAKVFGFGGEEVSQETTYSDFKEVNGLKRSMKSQTKRDGEKFIESEVLEYKLLDKVEADRFSEPK